MSTYLACPDCGIERGTRLSCSNCGSVRARVPADDGLCLECELGHPCQDHDRQPPPPPRARRGWLRRLVGRPRFPRPTRPDAAKRGGRVPAGNPPPPPRTRTSPPDLPPPPWRDPPWWVA